MAQLLNFPKADWENAVLKTRQEWENAFRLVNMLGLPPHPEPPKNWDTLAALHCILRETDPSATILDAGAEYYSAILPWLAFYGYQNLTGINLVFEAAEQRGTIRYEPGDLTQTHFPAKHFDAITCLSVIEHGVEPRAYFQEMARILKPGGILITSTDYYSEPIDTGSQQAFGVPLRIFTPTDIEQMLELARESGLVLTSALDLSCEEKAVTWQARNLSYTFLMFTLRKAVVG